MYFIFWDLILYVQSYSRFVARAAHAASSGFSGLGGEGDKAAIFGPRDGPWSIEGSLPCTHTAQYGRNSSEKYREVG
jgi:hypothetical protein